MSDRIGWIERPTVKEMIQAIDWVDDTAYMYLERVPTTFLGEQDRQNGLQLTRYDAGAPFEVWQRGRIFDAAHELKWEWQEGQYHIVYCGIHPPDGLNPGMLPSECKPVTYYLWGQQVQQKDAALVGLAAGDLAFIEQQIPRILFYPEKPSQGQRLRVDVYEYYSTNRQLYYSRWYGLR